MIVSRDFVLIKTALFIKTPSFTVLYTNYIFITNKAQTVYTSELY
jgi:hypothetical protein